MLSSLNCIGYERSSEERRGALPDPEPEEEDSPLAIVEAEKRYPTQEYYSEGIDLKYGKG